LTGDTLIPVIKTIYAEDNNYQKESSQQIVFVPVVKQDISVVGIHTVDDNLNNIIQANSNTYLELVFRSKKY